jgi:hypothetical protein
MIYRELIMVHSFFIDTPATTERIRFDESAVEIAVEATVADLSKALASAKNYHSL